MCDVFFLWRFFFKVGWCVVGVFFLDVDDCVWCVGWWYLVIGWEECDFFFECVSEMM